MGKAKRIWYAGAVYHITARGNHRNDIFRDEEDFKVYLMFLEEALFHFSHYYYSVLAYCLMDNHVHLVIKTDNNSLGILIARIHSRYTRYFNKKYNYIGHLFQDRYFSEIIESDTQLLETSRYVHLNPVKAKMVQTPLDYKWSSYSMLIGETEEKLIELELILKYFKYEDRFQLYRQFVEAKINKENTNNIDEEIEEVR